MRAALIYFSIVYLFVIPEAKSNSWLFTTTCDGCRSITTFTNIMHIWKVTAKELCPTDTPYCEPHLVKCVRDPPPSCAPTSTTLSHGPDTQSSKPDTSKSDVGNPDSLCTPESVTREPDATDPHTISATTHHSGNLGPNKPGPHIPKTDTPGSDPPQIWYTTEPNTSGLLKGAPDGLDPETPWIWPSGPDPTEPVKPKPDEPDAPDVPDKPDVPDTPDEPVTPDSPEPDTPWIWPSGSDKPEPETPWIWPPGPEPTEPVKPKPDEPDTPDEPDKPDVPDTPDKPDVPDTPDKPDTPDTPDKPDEPDTPDSPDPDTPIEWNTHG